MISNDLSLVSVTEREQTEGNLDTAELIVAYLEALGIDYVFGVPGGAIEPIYNALARSQRRGGPRPVVARHEAGAAFMADGYTRETGKIGVCCATSGPGATNLITGVACAYDNRIPMLVLTGQPMLSVFGKGALQESSCTGINTLGMFRHCTHYNSLVSHPEQLEAKLIAALMRAMRTPRGPVHLSIPLDILKSKTTHQTPSYDVRHLLARSSSVDEAAIERLYKYVQTARNIVLLVGGDCGEASGAILQFAAAKQVRIVTTPDGKGLISPNHPLMHGVFGFAGHASSEAVLRDPTVDLILAAGTSMGEWTSSGWSESLLNNRLIHIDDSEEHLARTPMAKLHVRGRILTVFERLADYQRAERNGADSGPTLNIADWRRHDKQQRVSKVQVVAPEMLDSEQAPLMPQRLMRDLGRLFPPSTRYLADSGNSVAWAIHYLQPLDRRQGERRNGGERKLSAGRRKTDGGWLRVTMDFAPMGWAIGGAVGTAMANPDVPVVCITGDGSMLMNGQEISVAVAEQLTVIYVVLNDAALGMVKHGQRLAGAESIAYTLPPTDFAAMARAMGAQAYSISSPAELNALDINAICSSKGPTLLDVRIDSEEIPPMKLRMRVLGTAL